MDSNIKLGLWETICTISSISIIPILLTVPTYGAETFGSGLFAHNVYTFMLSGIILAIIFGLYKTFENMNIIDISEYVGGAPLKIVSGLIVGLYLLTLSTLTLSELVQNTQMVLFDDAPIEYLIILFGIVITICASLGLKSIFKSTSLLFPLLMLSGIFMFFTLFKDIDFTNFSPFFGNSVSTFWLQGFNRVARIEGIFFILLAVPNINNFKKAGYTALIIVTVLILAITFLLVGIYPYPAIIESHVPIFQLTRFISFGRFVQRIESVYVLLWLLISFVYLSLLLATIVAVFKKSFNLKYNNRLVPLASSVVIATSSLLCYFELASKIRLFIFTYISSYIFYVVPIILLIIARIKRRVRCKKEAPSS